MVTATATDPQGNTSEVSARRRATLQAPAQVVRLVPGQPLIFSAAAGDGIALHDPDAGPLDPAWDLTLSVATGTLTLSGTAGLTGSGDGTGSLPYSGSLSALNAALDGLTFTPAAGSHGNTALSLSAASAGALPLQSQVLITDGVFLVTTHGRHRPRLAPPGDPRLQRRDGRHEHDRLRHPGRGRPDDRPALAAAGDHQPGADRRLLPAGLRRHAADRAERQPGRRR